MINTTLSERTLPDRHAAERQEARNWIDRILKDKNWTPTDLARQSVLAPSTLLRFLNDERNHHSLSFSTIKKISDGSGYAVPRSLMEAHGITQTEINGDRNERPRSLTASGDLGPSTVRLISVSPFPEGIQPINRDVRRVPRPQELMGDSTAFAFFMPDDALAPLIPERTMMFATKLRDPARDDLVMITDTSGISKVRLVRDVTAAGIGLEEPGSGSKKASVVRVPRERIKELGIVRVMVRP